MTYAVSDRSGNAIGWFPRLALISVCRRQPPRSLSPDRQATAAQPSLRNRIYNIRLYPLVRVQSLRSGGRKKFKNVSIGNGQGSSRACASCAASCRFSIPWLPSESAHRKFICCLRDPNYLLPSGGISGSCCSALAVFDTPISYQSSRTPGAAIIRGQSSRLQKGYIQNGKLI